MRNNKTTAAQSANEEKSMHPGVKLIIACSLITTIALALKWVYYDSGWHERLRQGIATAGIMLLVGAGITAIVVYVKEYYEHFSTKKAEQKAKPKCFPQKYLYPSGIILLAINKKSYEGYYQLFCRLEPTKEQCERIGDNEFTLLMRSLAIGAFIASMTAIYLYHIPQWWDSPAGSCVVKCVVGILSFSILPAISIFVSSGLEEGLDRYMKRNNWK